MSSIIVNNTERNWRKTIKTSLAFVSEVDRSLFLAPPLRATSCNVHYSGSIWQWKRDLEQANVPQALSACLFLSIGLFVKGEKLVPQPQSIIIDSVATTRTRQNVNIDLIQCCIHMPYKIHWHIVTYFYIYGLYAIRLVHDFYFVIYLAVILL
jgi:hypothetical protein